MDPIISKTVGGFESWFIANRGYFHPNAQFQQCEQQSSAKRIIVAQRALQHHSDDSGYEIEKYRLI